MCRECHTVLIRSTGASPCNIWRALGSFSLNLLCKLDFYSIYCSLAQFYLLSYQLNASGNEWKMMTNKQQCSKLWPLASFHIVVSELSSICIHFSRNRSDGVTLSTWSLEDRWETWKRRIKQWFLHALSILALEGVLFELLSWLKSGWLLFSPEEFISITQRAWPSAKRWSRRSKEETFF